MIPRTAVRSVVFGKSESGKGVFSKHVFLGRAPRVLHIDPNGEALYHGGAEDVIVTDGVDKTLDALAVAADYDRWEIAAFIPDPADVSKLFAQLIEKPSAAAPSLAEMLGGVAIECGECSTLAPLGKTTPATKGMWLYGRHRGITGLHMCSQRPVDCDIVVRDQSDYIVSFQFTTDRYLQWFEKNIDEHVPDHMRSLPKYHGIFWKKDADHFDIFDGRRPRPRIYRRVWFDGRVRDVGGRGERHAKAGSTKDMSKTPAFTDIET